MNYQSTRDSENKKVTSAQAIKQGLADDGGLFVPDEIPVLTKDDILALSSLSYAERAADILSRFLTDYTHDELLTDCKAAYSDTSFVGGAAPLKNIHDNIYSLELWHGPTAAFKDMALQIMPRLLSRALVKTGEKRTALILVATSGDTGKAALEGYRDIDRVKIMVFYPTGGVSRVQKLQMATQEGSNVNVLAIKGNFDDAQSNVKKIFGDKSCAEELDRKGFFLSSANSINWGRLVPQVVYYVSAYCDLVSSGKIHNGDNVNFCVPTGNFGNIFAAYIAKQMGLPIGKLICASNMNNVLTDFLETGTYDRNREFHLTMSPSMDILISSNLERLLYFCAGAEETRKYMTSLSEIGKYTVSDTVKSKIDELFVGYCTDEKMTSETIRTCFEKYGYLADTHTAVGISAAERYVSESGDKTVTVVDSTASPYKFAASVYGSLGKQKPSDPLDAIDELSEFSGTEIAYPLKDLAKRKIRFDKIIEPSEMLREVLDFAK